MSGTSRAGHSVEEGVTSYGRWAATLAAGALAVGTLASAATAAGTPAAPGRGIEATVRSYLGVSPSTRVVVGAPVAHGNHVTVSVQRYAGPLAGEGDTLVLERVSGRWQVTSAARRPDWVNWASVRPRRGA